MGMKLFSGCGAIVTGNPNPKRFIIVSIIEGKNTYAEIYYPDCTNYEGRKILVYAGKVAGILQQAKEIDPHFQESGLNLLARFAPTEQGKRLAIKLCEDEI